MILADGTEPTHEFDSSLLDELARVFAHAAIDALLAAMEAEVMEPEGMEPDTDAAGDSQ